jgi:antitoxin VapB
MRPTRSLNVDAGWTPSPRRDILRRRLDIPRNAMPLYIKDDATAELVARLAKQRGVTKQAAVRLAVQAELDRASPPLSVRERLEKLWAENPLPPPTGKVADKAFFDELSGEA